MKRNIKFDKVKLSLMCLGSLLFVSTGFWLLTLEISEPLTAENILFSDQFLGFICIIFFTKTLFTSIGKLLSSKDAIIITDDGIEDNSTPTSLGFVFWSEIIEVEESKVNRVKYISIYLKNKEKYIKKSNFLNKILYIVNSNITNTPFNISSIALRINHIELYNLIKNGYSKSKT